MKIKSLVTSTPDQLLAVLETSSDDLQKAEEEAGQAEGALKAWEAAMYGTYRMAGKGVADSENLVRADKKWLTLFIRASSTKTAAAKAKRDYSKAELAIDLWRTEQATIRAIR